MEGVIHEKPVKNFPIVDVRDARCHIFICLPVRVRTKAARFKRLVHQGAGSERSKVYQTACASCHGAQLQGGGGPALVGKQFWLTYGGKKVSTLWSNVHTEMPMSAPGSVSAKNSTNVMAFLLQKNGVAAGTTPLDDTADLSKVLPPK